MALLRSPIARFRVRIAMAVTAVLLGVVMPVRADTTPPTPLPPGAAVAQAQLIAAQAQAGAADTALAQAQASLATSEAQLATLNARVASLNTEIATKTAAVQQLQQQEAIDRQLLSSYMLQTYSRGNTGALDYLLSSSSLSDVFNRQANIQSFAMAGQQLASRVGAEKAAAVAALAAVQQDRDKLNVAVAQAAATEQILAAQEGQVAAADGAAHAQVSATANTLEGILTAAQLAAQPPKDPGIVYSPVGTGTFTIDTDLTVPSGLSANTINAFLSGTALAGLGSAYMSAEQQYHVSARYLVAHSILESAWGTSAIAQQKYNLFGYGADDANPVGDAMTFSSFAACISYVAQKVEVNYLTPGGPYYHGPTLRGMNVDYASDPNWAVKIAAIANTIPG